MSETISDEELADLIRRRERAYGPRDETIMLSLDLFDALLARLRRGEELLAEARRELSSATSRRRCAILQPSASPTTPPPRSRSARSPPTSPLSEETPPIAKEQP